MRFLRPLGILVFITVFAALPVLSQEPTIEDLFEKHLNSIGNKQNRDQINNRLVMGLNEFTSRLPVIKGGGKALVVSNKDNLFFLLGLNSKEYPFEKVGYFKDKISLPYVTAGARSPLGAFLADHPSILDNGLFMGSMTSRWIGLDSKRYGGKFNLAGSKKVNGRKVWVVEYFPSSLSSNEFSLRLMFDAETFQHVRSEYYHEILGRQDTFGQLGRQAGAKLSLIEEFSDFKTVEGITAPYDYKTTFMTSSNSGTFEYSWAIKVSQYHYNQNLAPDFFTFDAK